MLNRQFDLISCSGGAHAPPSLEPPNGPSLTSNTTQRFVQPVAYNGAPLTREHTCAHPCPPSVSLFLRQPLARWPSHGSPAPTPTPCEWNAIFFFPLYSCFINVCQGASVNRQWETLNTCGCSRAVTPPVFDPSACRSPVCDPPHPERPLRAPPPSSPPCLPPCVPLLSTHDGIPVQERDPPRQYPQIIYHCSGHAVWGHHFCDVHFVEHFTTLHRPAAAVTAACQPADP